MIYVGFFIVMHANMIMREQIRTRREEKTHIFSVIILEENVLPYKNM